MSAISPCEEDADGLEGFGSSESFPFSSICAMRSKSEVSTKSLAPELKDNGPSVDRFGAVEKKIVVSVDSCERVCRLVTLGGVMEA